MRVLSKILALKENLDDYIVPIENKTKSDETDDVFDEWVSVIYDLLSEYGDINEDFMEDVPLEKLYERNLSEEEAVGYILDFCSSYLFETSEIDDEYFDTKRGNNDIIEYYKELNNIRDLIRNDDDYETDFDNMIDDTIDEEINLRDRNLFLCSESEMIEGIASYFDEQDYNMYNNINLKEGQNIKPKEVTTREFAHESELDTINRAAEAIALECGTKNVFVPMLNEASVVGGDYGRWKPATSAVGKAKGGLTKSLDKKTGEKYKFYGEGMPQSADGGSELWFAIESKNGNNYYLVLKYKDGEKWDVILKNGEGPASSKTVAHKKQINTGDLENTIKKIGGKNESS